MTNMYQVPSQILADQATKTVELYRQDSAENRQLLAGIGVSASRMDELSAMADELTDFELRQEEIRTNAVTAQQEATAAVQAIVDWRNRQVLPRVKIALRGDSKLRYFRAGQLRSTRAATVIREGRLLVGAMEKFSDDIRLRQRGINPAMIEQGKALIAAAEREDSESATAAAESLEATERVYELENRIDDVLSDIEHCAAIVFEPESATLKRYRMNEIRNYVASRQGHKNVDESSSVAQPDPMDQSTSNVA